MPTIYDVAKLAGVSAATVSRVLNGQNVSPERTELVRSAMAELGFQANRRARSLRRQQTEVIALIIPDIENPYFTELARGVEDVAQSAGLSVVLCNSDDRADKERGYLDIAVAENMAGVILATSLGQPDLSTVLRDGRAVVAVDRMCSAEVDAVVMPNRKAGEQATEGLVMAGYRRIACITGPDDIDTARTRAEGWAGAVARAGLDADGLLLHSDFRVDGGRKAMLDLLTMPEPPDAIVAANNLIAVGALQVLHEHDLTPPRVGVAVVGSLPFATTSPAALNVVRLPARQMGMTAAEILIERINGDDRPARTIELRSELQVASLTR